MDVRSSRGSPGSARDVLSASIPTKVMFCARSSLAAAAAVFVGQSLSSHSFGSSVMPRTTRTASGRKLGHPMAPMGGIITSPAAQLLLHRPGLATQAAAWNRISSAPPPSASGIAIRVSPGLGCRLSRLL